MSDPKRPKSPGEIQEEIQKFFKDKFGADVLSVPLGSVGRASQAAEDEIEDEGEDAVPDEVLAFDKKPREVKEYLDRWVVGQEEAKKTLAVAVCDHYNHVRRNLEARHANPPLYVKQNVILLGPTGVGKTYLMKILAQMIGVPFVKADSTKFSETGYVGGDVEDMVRELYRVAGGNALLAEHGIIFLDEVDKIAAAENPTGGRDPSGRGVQVSLLKLMEDTEVPLRNPLDLGSQFQDLLQMRQGRPARRTINTRHILFVVSGAFSGLPEIISRRLGDRSVGFKSGAGEGEPTPQGLLSRATTKDFVDYGFEPEFVGRLPIRCALDALRVEDLFRILRTAEGSILLQYRDSFRGYGIEVSFDDEALQEVARRAHYEDTGARGLMTVLEAALREFKFHLPGNQVRRFAVTRRVIENPRRALDELLANPERAAEEYARAAVREWEESFAARTGVALSLDSEAASMAFRVSDELDLTIEEYLDNTFRPHADFLHTILSRSGRDVLNVNPHILSRPAEGVGLWLDRGNAENV